MQKKNQADEWSRTQERIAQGRERIAARRAAWEATKGRMHEQALARIEASDRVQKLQLDHEEALLRITELEAELAGLKG